MRIGLVVNILDEEYQISIYEGIKQKAQELGIEVICFQQENLNFFRGMNFKKLFGKNYMNVDGVIILSSVILDAAGIETRQDLIDCWGNIPIISLGQELKGVPSILVQTDSSMKELLTHLVIDHEYRKFLYISGSEKHQDAKNREDTFIETMEAYKKQVPHLHFRIKHGWFTEGAAIEVMDDFVQEFPDYKPDVIVCANDNMAIGVYKYLKTHTNNTNLFNCAVTGVDDIPQSRFEIPALTTIRQPLSEISVASVEALVKIINEEKVEDLKYVESKYIQRSSCGCVRKFDEEYQKKFLNQIQGNYIRSENLLKMVSRIGHDLNYASTKDGLRYIINRDLDNLEIQNFSVLWFKDKTEGFTNAQLFDTELIVDPVYVRRNGKVVYAFWGQKDLTLGDFYQRYVSFDEIKTQSLVLRFLSLGKEIKGCVFYDAENTMLPYLSSIGIDISQTLNRVNDMEQKKKRSEYLESEVEKRTKELVEENKKRLEVEAEVLKISEIERQRFSTDLHDDICQRLAGISMLCRSYARQEDSVSKEEMAELAELISDTLSATRHYAHNSYPVEIESLGLNDSLNNLCNTFEKMTKISCEYSWQVSESVIFNDTQKINIFRIIQEALHNVMKHAEATNVKVAVYSSEGKVVICIEDNGCGISGDRKEKPGLGLNSMQYRANQIDSVFMIKPGFPHGTRIEVIIDKFEE